MFTAHALRNFKLFDLFYMAFAGFIGGDHEACLNQLSVLPQGQMIIPTTF